ncbi:Putative liporotein LppU [Mycobacteroides abscessus subsp. abscessus]|nr:Putative liporotein LppU [Mycobacteroides abscessus subsp. abscessus]SKO61464.1 Putative liporotein LppU [Mycobacteroides abscessus subsp. abscessus]
MDKNSVNKALRITRIVLIVAGLIGLTLTLFTDLPMSQVALYLVAAYGIWVVVDAIVNTSSRKQLYLKLAGVVAAVGIAWLVVVLLIRGIFAGGNTSSVDQQETEQTSFSPIAGQFPPDTKTINPDFPAGTCVNLHGSRTNAQVDKAGCGSPENNFIVVQQVQKPSECVGDVDQKYYTNTAGRGEWTVCMDYYWVQGSCLSMNGFEIKRVKCDDRTKPAREKPVRLALNSTNISSCPSGGYAHPVRRFVVCTETQTS